MKTIFQPFEINVTENHRRLAKIHEEQQDEIRSRERGFDRPLKNSIHGHVSEILLSELLPHCNLSNSEDYDMTAKVGDKRVTLDVKTVVMNHFPRADWLAQVTSKTRAKKSDAIGFMSINEEMTKAWAAGWLWRNEFFSLASWKGKGMREVWPSGRVFTYSADCYAVSFGRLRPFSFMISDTIKSRL